MTTDILGKDGKDRSREIRIALVLYGGVSLAVYENGVTRAFFDLVRENGPFGLLLEILDANAVVDVVAGTSAGGINGLFLAAALESGGDFAKTADLWRKHGDLGALLRPVTAADEAVSLLDGEGYYQQRLEEAFRSILTPTHVRAPSPGEMDVFITGTNLEGVLSTYWDSLGARIDDKTHRTVFRLQHRPGRKVLGLGPEDPAPRDTAPLRACILASIARITSTFPVAFPPFSLEQLPPDRREAVKEALERSSRTRPTHHVYVDGGVLDNKPFGPVLKAIFYRMPHKLVDRRLFYVEPDPAHLTPLTDEESHRLQNPFRVAVASLSTIPSHESIGEDLEKLKAHNARIRWLNRIKENYLELARPGAPGPDPASCHTPGEVYRRVRIDSLCTLMVSDSDDVPSAKTEISHPERKRLFQSLRGTLLELTAAEDTAPPGKGPAGWLHSYDVEWHLRCAFHVLYHLYQSMGASPEDEQQELLQAVKAAGRIIKALHMIRNRLYLLRDTLFEKTEAGLRLAPSFLLKSFAAFLDRESPLWHPLLSEFPSEATEMPLRDHLRLLADREAGPLRSRQLTRAASQAWQWIRETDPEKLERLHLPETPPETVFTALHEVLHLLIRSVPEAGNPIEDFVILDRAFYPVEFAAGIHELDEIEYVRISPRDAQTGLSAVAPSLKVTGDDMAHFAAFFRRDWRANDILWGRIDGICQIVRSLLDEGAQQRLWRNRWHLPDAITTESLDEHFQGCPLSQRKALLRSWRELLDTRPPEDCSEAEKADWLLKLSAFRDRFITAAQYHAVCQDLGTLYEDLYFQEIVWGTISDDTGVGPQTGETVVEARARERGTQARDAVRDCGSDLQEKALGSQTVVGPKGAVPAHILTEYACHAYLLVWGLLRTALQGHQKLSGFFSRRTPRWILRTPIAFFYHLVRAQRRQPRSFPVLVVGSVAALLACGFTGLFFGNPWFVLPIVAALAAMGITVWLKPEKK
ncbi:patatin-related protein [Desulfacinum infernum DSM 9756]|uniref:Patatin-related protein n=1 Tax=Desulfacinum infernum DSM 9756 TaxID=1121391 RepID=A0A1M4WK84_9BACT|nr:patatin-like protein [Desulfacinum infernum]SHE81669.1 patatin-related protein [Desulfacinum infernum DSM 9756]